jgi:hypothetical protein
VETITGRRRTARQLLGEDAREIVRWALRPTPPRARWIWACGLAFATLAYLGQVADALNTPISGFDDGILFSSISFLREGLVPFADFYSPYGAGLAVPGLLTETVTGHDVLAVRLTYGVAPAAVALLAPVVGARRAGPVVGLALGVIALTTPIPRYSLCWLSLLVMVLLIDRAARQASAPRLETVAGERPGLLALAGAALGTAAWWRAEYGVFAIVWAVLILFAVPGRRRWAHAAVPVAVAAAPYAVVIAAGGLDHLWAWARYSLVDFRRYRGLPITLGSPYDWVRAVWHGGYDDNAAVLLASYWAGAALVAAWIASRVVPGGRRVIGSDPTRVAVLLVVVAAIVLQAQTVRFGVTYGLAALVPIWLAAAAMPTRIWLRAAMCGLTAIALLPTLDRYEPGHLVDELSRSHPRPTAHLAGLDHIPFLGGEADTVTLLELPRALRRLGLAGSPIFVINRRNDIAPGNDALLYWWLSARPASWLMAFDPGLADRQDEQRSALRDLCRSGAPIIQWDQVFLNEELKPSEPRSRELDQGVALNWDIARVAGNMRILVRRPGACVMPERASSRELADRRDRFVGAGEFPAAGALAVELSDRSRALGHPVRPSDVATVVLGGYYVPDDQLPKGSLGEALLSLRDGVPRSLTTRAALEPQPFLAALATLTAWAQHPPANTSPDDRRRVVRRIVAAVRHHPRNESVQALLPRVVGPSPNLVRSLDRSGVRGATYDRWAFDGERAGGDLQEATARAQRLLIELAHDPYRAAVVLRDLGAAYSKAGRTGCANALDVRAAAVPGVVVPRHGPTASCPAVRRLGSP